MLDQEKLINAIEKQQCLWNIQIADYNSRDAKELAWEKVCKEVIGDWEMRTDKAMKSADLKRKWTNIRDYYRRSLQKMKKHPNHKKKYVYADMLDFLRPVFEGRDSEDNNCQSDHSDNARSESTTQETVKVKKEFVNVTEERRSSMSSDDLALNKLKENENGVPIPKRNKSLKRERTTLNLEEEDDTKFLLSFRSHMKRMSVNQKIDFQLGMLMLVKKICTRRSASSPSTSE